jgi:outer membrane protein assembly factor BamB
MTMSRRIRLLYALLVSIAGLTAASAFAQDWPQWRGPNRDGKATGFEAPETWPAELTQKWKVIVGEGPATPALVGDKLYVFARQDGSEIVRCLNADTGDEIWKDQYSAGEPSGGARQHSGPRSSPLVAEGRVVTFGVEEVLSCYDAESGQLLWRNEEFRGDGPTFWSSSSPILVDGLCVAQLGGVVNGSGFIIAYDLASGDEKWRWQGPHPAYGSPMVMTVNGTKAIVTPIEEFMAAVDAADGSLLWRMPYSQGRYNAASPIVDGQRLVIAGPGSGLTAFQMDKDGEELAAEKVWGNMDNTVVFNTPVLKDGLLFGLSNGNQLFCIDTKTGETAWTVNPSGEAAAAPQQGQRRGGGGGGGNGRRGGGGRGGYGSIVDAGSVMIGLPSGGPLVVFEPSTEFKQLASYKVSDTETHAYPVVAGNRIFIKDQDSVTLWAIE